MKIIYEVLNEDEKFENLKYFYVLKIIFIFIACI
jgi:hypothetical protein